MYNAPTITAEIQEIDAADSPTRIEFKVDGHSIGFVFPVEDRCAEGDADRVASRIWEALPFEVSLLAAREGVAKMLAVRGVWV